MSSPLNARALAGVLAASLTLTAGCGRSPSPTSPSGVAAPASSAIIYDASDTDSLINGSDAQLVGFDTVTRQLTFNTTKGVFTASFDNSTVFRDAQLPKFAPVDPCRQFATDYNTAGASVDTNGVYLAISAMAGSGCLARIHTDKATPTPPPIKSVRPLAGL